MGGLQGFFRSDDSHPGLIEPGELVDVKGALVMGLPAAPHGVFIPAVDEVGAVIGHTVQRPSGADAAKGDRRASLVGNTVTGRPRRAVVDIVTGNPGMVVVKLDMVRQADSTVHINAAAIAQLLGRILDDRHIRGVRHRQGPGFLIDAGAPVIRDGDRAVRNAGFPSDVKRPRDRPLAADGAVIVPDCDIGAISNGKIPGNVDAIGAVSAGRNGGVADGKASCGQAVGTVIIKVPGGVRNDKVGTVGAVTGAVDHVHQGIGNGRIECTGKAGAVIVGHKCGIRDIHIVAAVAAVPFQGILRIIPDSQRGTVFKIQLVIAAKVDRVFVAGIFAVHGHLHIVQCQGCVFAGADGLPVPLRGIGCGSDAVHDYLDVFEGQRLTPQSNAVLGKSDRGHRHALSRPDGQVLAEIQAIRNGVPQQFNGITIRRLLDGQIQRRILNLSDFGDSGFSLRQSRGGQQAEQHDARQQTCQ